MGAMMMKMTRTRVARVKVKKATKLEMVNKEKKMMLRRRVPRRKKRRRPKYKHFLRCTLS